MKDQLKTVREALESYLGGETDGMNGAFRNCCSTRPHEPHKDCEAKAALTAITQLEAMFGEPVARLHITETDTYPDIEVEVLDGTHLQPGMSPIPVYVAAPVAQQPTFDARRALEAIEALLSNIRRDAPSLSGKVMGFAEEVAAALRDKVAQQPHVGDSQFESWYSSEYDPNGKGDKQRARDAYAAGMSDPAAKHAQAEAVPDDQSKWCAYVAGVIGCYLGEADDSAKVKAIAGIIERRLWALAPQQAEAVSVECHEIIAGVDGNTVRKRELTEREHNVLMRAMVCSGKKVEAPQQAEAVPDVVRDAERYRWLFSSHTEAELAECDQKSLQPPHTKQDETLALLSGWYTTKEQADKAIDAAIEQQKGQS